MAFPWSTGSDALDASRGQVQLLQAYQRVLYSPIEIRVPQRSPPASLVLETKDSSASASEQTQSARPFSPKSARVSLRFGCWFNVVSLHFRCWFDAFSLLATDSSFPFLAQVVIERQAMPNSPQSTECSHITA